MQQTARIKKYFTNFTGNFPFSFIWKDTVKSESFISDIPQTAVNYQVNENGEYIIPSDKMSPVSQGANPEVLQEVTQAANPEVLQEKIPEATQAAPQETPQSPYAYRGESQEPSYSNDYSDFAAAETYYRSAVEPEQTPPVKKKRRKTGKKIGMACAGLAAAVMIAFSSIGIYSTFFEDKNTASTANNTEEQTPQTVQQTAATGNELSVSEINNKVAPAVVGITGQSGQNQGVGTGIIITEDGYIMTNAHVVSGMSNLVATLSDGTEHLSLIHI